MLLDVARVIDFLLRERFLGAEDEEDEDDQIEKGADGEGKQVGHLRLEGDARRDVLEEGKVVKKRTNGLFLGKIAAEERTDDAMWEMEAKYTLRWRLRRRSVPFRS